MSDDAKVSYFHSLVNIEIGYCQFSPFARRKQTSSACVFSYLRDPANTKAAYLHWSQKTNHYDLIGVK